jgi:thioredoxin 1
MATTTANHVTLTAENFHCEVIANPHPVLVDFWAPWCGPCQVMNPILAELAAEYDGRVSVGKVNVDEQPNLAAQYGVQAIPTLILFCNGEEIERVVGATRKQVLAAKLAGLLHVA